MSKFDLNIRVLDELPPKQSTDFGETHIVEYSEFDVPKQTASNESIAAGMEAYDPMTERAKETNYILNCIDEGGSRRCSRMLIWTKKIDPETKNVCWTFYLNMMFLNFPIINDFVNKMYLPKAEDCVHIYLPAEVYIDDAEVIHSAIMNCKTKKICMTAPYILNSGAAYLMTAATHLDISPACVAHIDMSNVGGGGAHADAINALLACKTRASRILFKLRDAGFITPAHINHIMDNQGEIVLFGDEYQNILKQYNDKFSDLWK